MKTLRLIAFAAISGSSCLAAGLPRSSPEAQGVSSPALLAFVEEADRRVEAMNSFMLVRHGRVVAEGWWSPYGAESPHSLYSLSKSFTSTAVGLAIAEGKMGLDDEVLRFFPEDAPADPGKNLESMRVSDLLRMSTGHQVEPSRPPGRPRAEAPASPSVPSLDPAQPEQTWARSFLAHPVPHKPGTHFLYNTSATYMASAIVQKATGMTVLDYLRPRLFEPLGIENPTWEASPQGITAGGFGLNVRTEDIAKFGQLYLQKGKWDGKQLVPAAWVEAATARQTSNGSNPRSDWDQGYGYQFWRCRNGAYRGDGAFGQYCVVLPEEDAVIAITRGVGDMQGVLDLVWEKLLPALRPGPTAADEAARARLGEKLKGLSVRAPEGSAPHSKLTSRSYAFPANDRKLESIRLEEDGGAVTLVARIDGGDRRIACGQGSWTKGRFGFGPLPDQPAAASGAWTEGDAFTAKICFYETPFILTFRLKFDGDGLLFDSQANVGFGATKQPRLVGKAE